MSDLSLQKLKQASKEIAAEYKRAQEALEAAEKAAREQEQFKKNSGILLVQILGDIVDRYIKQGKLNIDVCTGYFGKYAEVIGNEQAGVEYVRTVIKLLTHEYWGVESTTARLSNGGLIYYGKTYENVEALYNHIQTVVGNDPFGHISWFQYILNDIFTDETKVLVDFLPSDNWRQVLRIIQDVVKLNAAPISASSEDLKKLTAEDALQLTMALGGF